MALDCQEFFIYVPIREKDVEHLLFFPPAQGSVAAASDAEVVDESWTKIPLQDQLVVYARLSKEAEA